MGEKERLVKLHDEFITIMREYRKNKEKSNETMAYFRAINDNINTLKDML